jgi:hypothetical protein
MVDRYVMLPEEVSEMVREKRLELEEKRIKLV